MELGQGGAGQTGHSLGKRDLNFPKGILVCIGRHQKNSVAESDSIAALSRPDKDQDSAAPFPLLHPDYGFATE